VERRAVLTRASCSRLRFPRTSDALPAQRALPLPANAETAMRRTARLVATRISAAAAADPLLYLPLCYAVPCSFFQDVGARDAITGGKRRMFKRCTARGLLHFACQRALAFASSPARRITYPADFCDTATYAYRHFRLPRVAHVRARLPPLVYYSRHARSANLPALRWRNYGRR